MGNNKNDVSILVLHVVCSLIPILSFPYSHSQDFLSSNLVVCCFDIFWTVSDIVFKADSCQLAWFGLKKAAFGTIIIALCLEQWCRYHDLSFTFGM